MPTAVETYPKPTLADLKNSMVKDGHPAKVVPDDFMYEFKYPVDLPTIERLGGYKFDIKTDTVKVAQTFVDDWQAAMANNDAEAFTGLFLPGGVWRDKIVYSWEYRTFNGQASIAQAAEDLFPRSPSKKFRLLEPTPSIQDPYPDLNYLQLHASFETDVVGASAVVNLVNTADGVKVWTLHTVIESLHEFPELPNRDGHMVGPLSWLAQREIDTRFDDSDPQVVIVGGGHNGLMMAARLKALGVPALVIERNERIGDNWRKRYEALSLHFPHWADHLPYMPYPDHWPVYTPAAKLGDWLEWYASAMELYTWTDSNVTSCSQNETTGEWTLGIDRGGKENRTLHPKHVVMATSLAGVPMLPKIPGMDTFKGTIRHSTAHDSSRDWIGKKVMVVGTSSSGFDTAYDFARRGIDVTILQRSPTYLMSLTHSVPKIIGIYEPKDGSRPSLDIADRIAYSMPVGPGEELGRRLAEDLATLDKDLIDGMESAGFKTYRGQRGTGTQTLGYTRNGGFYFDAGACEQVMNGKIRVEQGSIDRFAEDKVILNGNRDQHYDLVVMATGFSNTIDSVRRTLGQDIADRCKPIWGMDAEGELNSAWRNCGVPNLWIMVGTLQHGRYHSKRVALRIKAMLEGVAKKPYEA